ncbi:MAG TPA: hypothetical protein VFK35_07410 [Candidatus Limnocylindrales bacterium]|nr:hypothetical protein [Candidatus Limnocylindrales bacterium]
MLTLARHWSAWLPMLVSAAAFALVAGWFIVVGPERTADEGMPARLFGVLVLVNAFAIGYFGSRWLPVARRPAAVILLAQLILAAVPVALIMLLEASIRA